MPNPTELEIAQVAYFIWEDEGRPTGRDVAHWHQAELTLRERKTPSASTRRAAKQSETRRKKN